MATIQKIFQRCMPTLQRLQHLGKLLNQNELDLKSNLLLETKGRRWPAERDKENQSQLCWQSEAAPTKTRRTRFLCRPGAAIASRTNADWTSNHCTAPDNDPAKWTDQGPGTVEDAKSTAQNGKWRACQAGWHTVQETAG